MHVVVDRLIEVIVVFDFIPNFVWVVLSIFTFPFVVYFLVRFGSTAYFKSKKDYYHQLWSGERRIEHGKRREAEKRGQEE